MGNLDSEEEKLRLTKAYAAMVDDELLHVAEDMNSLTDSARDVIKTEIERRGLTLPVIAPPASPDIPEADAKIVTVASFRDMQEALLAQSLLDSAEVKSFLVNEDLARILWSNVVGGIYLQVREEDAEAAREILDQPINEEFSRQEDEAADQGPAK